MTPRQFGALAATLLAMGSSPAAAGPAASPASAPASRATAPVTGASACYDAHEAAQIERKAGAWRKARGLLATCGRLECPAIVQRDCVTWAAELAAEQPSVVIAVVRDDGSDVLGATVFVDSEPAPNDGHALEIDPGTHRARVELVGHSAFEQSFVVREGERARRVAITVPSGPSGGKQAESRAPSLPTYVLGGVAALALGSFGTFAVLGKSEENRLADTCRDRCSDDDVSGVHRSYVIADVSLGVAIVAAGAAVVTWLFLPPRGTTRER